MDEDRAMGWQRVHTVHDYYDGPIFGIADYGGKPHVYNAEWNSSEEEYGPLCRLAEIEPELLTLVLEDWEIWLRWEDAIRLGLTTPETHPALPADRERHEALKSEIGGRLEAKRNGPMLKKAEFRWRAGIGEVLWSDD